MTRRELLAMGALAWSVPPIFGAKRQKVLYFTRSAGFEHSVVKRTGAALSYSENILTELGKRAGFDVECTKDGRVFDGNLDAYDAIAFYTSADLTGPSKDGGPPMTLAGKKKLLDAISAGKGFVGFHACTDSFHSKGDKFETQTDVDPYIAMIGGEFVIHGAQQEASLVIAGGFPGMNLGMGEGIAFTEEWYALKNFAKDLHVVLVQETKMMKGAMYQRPDYPSTWVRMHGQGRVFYTSLGHREDVWDNPFFQAIALGALSWTMRNAEFNVKPNIDEVTPQANLPTVPGKEVKS
jgi:type 1 glutamine amidotransferase